MAIAEAQRESAIKIEPTDHPHVVRRSDRGLCVADTRVTLYCLMDLIDAGWPRNKIHRWYPIITREQLDDVYAYIEDHRDEFAAEYEEVVRESDRIEAYYRAKEEERRKERPPFVPPPGKEAAWARLQDYKRRRGMQ